MGTPNSVSGNFAALRMVECRPSQATTRLAEICILPLGSLAKDEQVSAAVFQVIATIPMEWLGPTVRESLPFDVEEFFRRLKEGGLQNG